MDNTSWNIEHLATFYLKLDQIRICFIVIPLPLSKRSEKFISRSRILKTSVNITTLFWYFTYNPYFFLCIIYFIRMELKRCISLLADKTLHPKWQILLEECLKSVTEYLMHSNSQDICKGKRTSRMGEGLTNWLPRSKNLLLYPTFSFSYFSRMES